MVFCWQEEMNMNNFRSRLLEAMSNRNMTATDLVIATGIDKGSISNYINGKYIPKQDKCFRIAEALDVDPGWLMTGDQVAVNRFNKGVVLTIKETTNLHKNPEFIDLAIAWDKAEDWQKSAVRKLLNMKEGLK